MGNSFLTRQRFGFLRQARECLVYKRDETDRDYCIYSPGKFILGNFKERDGGFKLNRQDIYYEDSLKALCKYENLIQEKKIEIFSSLPLSDETLEIIAQRGRIYRDAKDNISEVLGILA